jgi:serine/threonine protein kinase
LILLKILKPKIIDFGLSIVLVPGQKTKDVCGTLPYCSPEIVKKDLYDCKTDIWSIGILIYAILRGRLPFITEDKKVTISNIVNEPIDMSHVKLAGISQECRDIIMRMLAKE